MSNSSGVRNGTEKNPYTSSPYTKIGERIGQLRKQAGLKQEELGRAVGVTTQAVSRWECGGAPDIELLPAIADTLHVSVDELFGRTPVAQTNIKELFDRTLYSYPKKDRMKAACDLMWNIQKAVLRCEDSNIDRVAVSNILDAATQKNQRKTTQSQMCKIRMCKAKIMCMTSKTSIKRRHTAQQRTRMLVFPPVAFILRRTAAI